MPLFGDLLVQLDPWQVDYGTELPLDEVEEAAPDDTVALDVEIAPEDWQPIRPTEGMQPSKLIFVDGVRRIEARLLARRQERLCHGAFGSHAVGAAVVVGSAAKCETPRIGRLIVIGSGESVGAPVAVKSDLVYQPLSTADTHPDAPLRTLQENMRREEERLGRELATTDGVLVVADGPLTFAEVSRAAVLGYIKRIFRLYLPRERLELLARLNAGERTPLFALRSSRRFVRFSWFVRLARPEPGDFAACRHSAPGGFRSHWNRSCATACKCKRGYTAAVCARTLARSPKPSEPATHRGARSDLAAIHGR